MTYLLDTNVCIRYINGRSSQVAEKLKATPHMKSLFVQL